MPTITVGFFIFMKKDYNCKTKYPIFLVHGMGFRDGKICYWGRIPDVLRKYGADVYFGCQDANASVESNCNALKISLEKVLSETGAEKVNIIAHSKGGVEARSLISTMGMGYCIASLTTLSTPHKGSRTMDKLMKLPKFLLKAGSKVFDFFERLGGDKNPDTYRCLEQLTTEFMDSFNSQNPDDGSVYYQSYAFKMKNPFSDVIMTIPYIAVRLLNGESDGMLAPDEVVWGNFRGVFTGTGNRGISHPDEVDLLRRPFSKKTSASENEISDITDFYARIICELRERGL